MQNINGYNVDETKGFRLTKGKNEKFFDNYADAVAFMRANYGYMLTYNYVNEESEKGE